MIKDYRFLAPKRRETLGLVKTGDGTPETVIRYDLNQKLKNANEKNENVA